MKNIIVACGGAVATSTLAAERIRDLCKQHNIPATVSQHRISELGSVAGTADLIVTTAKISRNYGVPVVHGIATPLTVLKCSSPIFSRNLRI